jgi:S1-C subfamily serine protease
MSVQDQPESQGAPYPGSAYPGSQSPQAGAGFPAGPGIPPPPPPGAGSGYGGYAGYPGPGGPGVPPPPPPPPPGGSHRRPRRMLAGIVATGIAFAGGAGATAWAVGVPGTSLGGALTNSRTMSTASIVQKTDPAVVDIVSNLGDQGAESAGTGIVLTSTGEVLTNNHVIDGATAIRVTEVGTGRTYSASVVGYDVTHDIAVLKMTGASGLTTATIGDSSDASVGEKVVAVGNAGGKGGLPSVATGQVTGLNKSITAVDEGSGSSERLTGMIKTNADIQAGDSGGPLLNPAGQVIGIDTAALTAEAQNATQSVQAFAIPINRAIATASQIEAGTASAIVHIGPTAFLGVEVSGQGSGGFGQGSTTSGAAVEGVVQGGAAASAGITGGDVIVSVGGRTVTSPTDLRNDLVTYHPGATVSIGWQDQSGQAHSAKVVLGSGPAA